MKSALPSRPTSRPTLSTSLWRKGMSSLLPRTQIWSSWNRVLVPHPPGKNLKDHFGFQPLALLVRYFLNKNLLKYVFPRNSNRKKTKWFSLISLVSNKLVIFLNAFRVWVTVSFRFSSVVLGLQDYENIHCRYEITRSQQLNGAFDLW